MEIAYVARHGCGGADDEGAIFHALTALGHGVARIHESEGQLVLNDRWDLVLFHKWHNFTVMEKLRGRAVRVFWYFDLVAPPADRSLQRVTLSRRTWMGHAMSRVEVGFCTDGDWVAQDRTGKLVWLPQGADERVVGFGRSQPRDVDILFAGLGCGGGEHREAFVAELRERWGDRLLHVGRGVYGRDLANLVARSKVVVAPDCPTTDRYWSNRVWVMQGYGALLLHPYCGPLASMYAAPQEIKFYRSREEMHDLIAWHLGEVEARAGELAELPTADEVNQQQRVAALERTRREHLYRHRCEKLIQTVKERFQ